MVLTSVLWTSQRTETEGSTLASSELKGKMECKLRHGM